MRRKIRYLLITKTVPEWSKRDKTLYTCSIGISPELGLIRLYPLPPVGMDKYGIYELEVEKNKRDPRNESWKITSYARKEEWTNFDRDIKYCGRSSEAYVGEYLNNHISNSISELNMKRKSIGVLKVNKFKAEWDINKNFVDSCQGTLFDDVGGVELGWHTSYTKDTKEKDLRVKFYDADGFHNIQFNEWHYYEGQRMFGAKKELLNPLNSEKRNLLLIGNMLQYQNSWIGLGKFIGTRQMKLIQ